MVICEAFYKYMLMGSGGGGLGGRGDKKVTARVIVMLRIGSDISS